MNKLQIIKLSDIIWLDKINELIEIVQIGRPDGMVAYYDDKSYIGTNKCKVCDPWIIFRYGVKVGTTREQKK